MKRKLSIPTDRAAYGPSQPLFNALRHACTSLLGTHQVLEEARDTAQRVHVQVDRDGTVQCEKLFRKAWQQTQDAYASVLDEVQKIDAEWAGRVGVVNGDGRRGSGEGGGKRRKVQHDAVNGHVDIGSSGVMDGEATGAAVQTKDVTAEVERRLQEKQSKRKAKKDKKRKRETGDSLDGTTQTPPTPKVVPKKARALKKAAKKAKLRHEREEALNVEGSASKGQNTGDAHGVASKAGEQAGTPTGRATRKRTSGVSELMPANGIEEAGSSKPAAKKRKK